MLKINVRQNSGIVILELVGQLTLGPGHAGLWKQAEPLVRAGLTNAVVDLRGLSKIDEAGLGELTLFMSHLRKAGGKAVLLNPDTSAIGLSGMIEIETQFQIFTDEQDAINAFFPGRSVKRYNILEFATGAAGRENT